MVEWCSHHLVLRLRNRNRLDGCLLLLLRLLNGRRLCILCHLLETSGLFSNFWSHLLYLFVNRGLSKFRGLKLLLDRWILHSHCIALLWECLLNHLLWLYHHLRGLPVHHLRRHHVHSAHHLGRHQLLLWLPHHHLSGRVSLLSDVVAQVVGVDLLG